MKYFQKVEFLKQLVSISPRRYWISILSIAHLIVFSILLILSKFFPDNGRKNQLFLMLLKIDRALITAISVVSIFM